MRIQKTISCAPSFSRETKEGLPQDEEQQDQSSSLQYA